MRIFRKARANNNLTKEIRSYFIVKCSLANVDRTKIKKVDLFSLLLLSIMLSPGRVLKRSCFSLIFYSRTVG